MTVSCKSAPRFSDLLGDTEAITVPGPLEDVGLIPHVRKELRSILLAASYSCIIGL